jgi:hypothetical protein
MADDAVHFDEVLVSIDDNGCWWCLGVGWRHHAGDVSWVFLVTGVFLGILLVAIQ